MFIAINDYKITKTLQKVLLMFLAFSFGRYVDIALHLHYNMKQAKGTITVPFCF
jgi:hypothetical protein